MWLKDIDREYLIKAPGKCEIILLLLGDIFHSGIFIVKFKSFNNVDLYY